MNPLMKKTVGQLRSLRMANHIAQKDMAKAMGMMAQDLSRVERDRKTVSLSFLTKYLTNLIHLAPTPITCEDCLSLFTSVIQDAAGHDLTVTKLSGPDMNKATMEIGGYKVTIDITPMISSLCKGTPQSYELLE
jgi:transcriptional regulator with XRE-family HTH domain